MATNLVRFEAGDGPSWGVVTGAEIAPLTGEYPTTAALIEQGEADWRAARSRSARIAMASVKILAPVTTPCRLYCQGANYRQHMVESGMDPDAKLFNMFFTKADASVCSGREKVTRPAHVKLLDYEIELALVFRRPISSAVTVTRETLPEYVFAITIANDLSARDVQLPQTQFFKGKSYRGFCPIGPWLTVPERDEFPRIDDLALELDVNGAPRQRDTTANLVFKPAETISELSTFADIRSRRRALDRHAERLRAAGAAAATAPAAPGPAGARAVEAVPQRTGASAAISQTGRPDHGTDPQPRRRGRSRRTGD